LERQCLQVRRCAGLALVRRGQRRQSGQILVVGSRFLQVADFTGLTPAAKAWGLSARNAPAAGPSGNISHQMMQIKRIGAGCLEAMPY